MTFFVNTVHLEIRHHQAARLAAEAAGGSTAWT